MNENNLSVAAHYRFNDYSVISVILRRSVCAFDHIASIEFKPFVLFCRT
jgi:hypothetical protein